MQISNQQKKEDIREAQIYLRVISENDPDIPQVIPDGIYGIETEQAVLAFQKKYGLEPTGKIDAATWEQLYKEYLASSAAFAPLDGITPLTENNVPLREGDAGYLVYILQAMINTVAQFYDNIDGTSESGVYDDSTAEAVKKLQEISGLPADGIVNAPTWNALAKLYNFHAAIDEKDEMQNIPTEAVGTETIPTESAPMETPPSEISSVG